ncbi:hypothetical protein [Pedobacter rhodius]|uniref:Uncharacterized protein n=1 Tax=Pedobacter rhodius TaxID=3004098 RepID=A0ABT4L194_9SPHI|nr:hypothetical protein [Pedobacter sp. SJ11]MCZ4224937.1 hypothetical protein [Pedobacter sp. SJ11]
MTNLNNALTNLQTSLNPVWRATLPGQINLASTLEQNRTSLETELLSKVEPVLSNLFTDLNKSIIEGEYANDLAAAKQVLANIEAHIVASATFNIPGQIDYTAFSQGVFSEKFLMPARNAIKDFNKLLESVKGQLNFEPNVDILFHLFKNEYVIDLGLHADLRLFKLNVQVAFIDHSLKFDNGTFRKLIMYVEALSAIAGVGSISDILKTKCEFLISKLAHRFDTDKTTKYGIDFQYHSFNITNPPELAYYDNVIKGHYDGIYTDEFKNRYKTAISKFEHSQSSLTFDDYHALIKYYKDIKPSLKKSKELLVAYDTLYTTTSSISDFDKRSRDLVYSYLENNVLSLELDEGEFTIENWELKFSQYTEKATVLKNSNFFPFFKIIDKFLKVEIQEQFNLEVINFDRVNGLIKAYEQNLSKLSDNLSICQTTNYLTYQLDYSGCKTTIVDITGASWSCFIASSFVLPLDFAYWRKIADDLSSELVKLKALRDLRVSLRKDITEIYDVKNKLAESDKRHIEILSIFAAIVLFVSNEVQLYSKLKSVADAVVFTLFFAYALGLFVMMIWFVTRPAAVNLRKLPTTHRILIGVFLSGFISAGIYLYCDYNSDSSITIRSKMPMEKRIDSLKQQVKMDSLKFSQKKYLP